MNGEEVTDMKTLARIQTVEELMPKPLAGKKQPSIGEDEYKVLELCFQMDSTVEEACIHAGISVPAYYKHREKNPEFARRMDLAKQFPMMAARAAVQRRIRQGDAKVALDYMKLRDRRFKPDAMPDDAEGTNKTQVTFNIVQTKGADQLENDSQTPTSANYAYEGLSNSGEAEKMTPWENEDQVLGNIGG